VLWFWILAGSAILLGLASFRGERARSRYILESLANPWRGECPPATVIVPVKGVDEGLAENLAALTRLDHPDYELIVVARAPANLPDGVTPPTARIVYAGDGDPDTGEKINNLLAAVNVARPESEVFAFADSDGRPTSGWLRALVGALDQPGAGAATGYRWHAPEPPDFFSLLRSVWNAVIAGAFGPGNNRLAWGGAMAIGRETFSHIRVPDFWRGGVSDDYLLARAVKSAGLRIAYAPGALVPSPDHTTAAEFFGWIRRQMIITHAYNPRMWWMAFVAHVIYCAAMAASITVAWRGSLLGEYALVAQLFLGMLKGANRTALAKAALPEYKTWFARYGWVHTWWTPLATWTWLYACVASAWSRTIEWRGRRYRL
jgi:ceramide glucosyltransferase